MEENSRLETTTHPLDLAASGLTRTASDSSSVTVDNSKGFIRRNTNARPSKAWTDQKHNFYLASLEASFVKKLHHSLGLLSRQLEQNIRDPGPSRQLPVHANSCDQIKVLQDGSWKKKFFERHRPLQYSTAGPNIIIESPWIRHFRCSSEHSTSADLRECSMLFSEGMPLRGKRIFSHGLSSLGQQCVRHKFQEDTVGSVAEVSDQNFVDEDRVEKSLSGPKRLKRATADSSTKDQIVPSENPFTAKISTAANTSSESDEQVHREFLLENVESVICPGPDVKSFLRKS
ncbi:Altered inheritance of mitochondria protein [Actinidia chinensis var. chinensis]|uniref:Altered inheritance of mitochondria protein n=1 Tax=Actinidia chinensis var. chinensis TaxID=1590841 RepID=A0A2R6Q615_ACTCC|nr:Altered inheritance of mitochondria protein [Actinidia chinensis var. chinensis]